VYLFATRRPPGPLLVEAASVPSSQYRLAPGNGGEVVLMLGYALTTARLSRRSTKQADASPALA